MPNNILQRTVDDYHRLAVGCDHICSIGEHPTEAPTAYQNGRASCRERCRSLCDWSSTCALPISNNILQRTVDDYHRLAVGCDHICSIGEHPTEAPTAY